MRVPPRYPGIMNVVWSQAENEIVVSEYFAMLSQELSGQSYTKARHRERIEKATGRTSVDFKLRNVSAVLEELRIPRIRGLKPATNRQGDALTRVIHDYLEQHPTFFGLVRSEIQREATPRTDYRLRESPPPTNLAFPHGHAPIAIHTDFALVEAANRSLGFAGELLMLDRERDTLQKAGRGDLASQVEHVSATKGDGLGYDILSFQVDGTPKFIEVKTTRRTAEWPMHVSRNELVVSKQNADSYVLARIFDFTRPEVGLFQLYGAIPETCILEPESWRALPRAN